MVEVEEIWDYAYNCDIIYVPRHSIEHTPVYEILIRHIAHTGGWDSGWWVEELMDHPNVGLHSPFLLILTTSKPIDLTPVIH